jgi:hypothetical protein
MLPNQRMGNTSQPLAAEPEVGEGAYLVGGGQVKRDDIQELVGQGK